MVYTVSERYWSWWKSCRALLVKAEVVEFEVYSNCPVQAFGKGGGPRLAAALGRSVPQKQRLGVSQHDSPD